MVHRTKREKELGMLKHFGCSSGPCCCDPLTKSVYKPGDSVDYYSIYDDMLRSRGRC